MSFFLFYYEKTFLTGFFSLGLILSCGSSFSAEIANETDQQILERQFYQEMHEVFGVDRNTFDTFLNDRDAQSFSINIASDEESEDTSVQEVSISDFSHFDFPVSVREKLKSKLNAFIGSQTGLNEATAEKIAKNLALIVDGVSVGLSNTDWLEAVFQCNRKVDYQETEQEFYEKLKLNYGVTQDEFRELLNDPNRMSLRKAGKDELKLNDLLSSAVPSDIREQIKTKVHNLIKTKTALTDQEIQDVVEALGSMLGYGTYNNIDDENLIYNIVKIYKEEVPMVYIDTYTPNKKLLTYSDFEEISKLLGYDNSDLEKVENFFPGFYSEDVSFRIGNRVYNNEPYDGLLNKDVADHIIKVIEEKGYKWNVKNESEAELIDPNGKAVYTTKK
ncbi:MAG: hypothetical protein IJ481_03730 [Alphaproteobacteria bacterium]|nr:hypothetical protein [Alphaproteobacteria bacterium]